MRSIHEVLLMLLLLLILLPRMHVPVTVAMLLLSMITVHCILWRKVVHHLHSVWSPHHSCANSHELVITSDLWVYLVTKRLLLLVVSLIIPLSVMLLLAWE